MTFVGFGGCGGWAGIAVRGGITVTAEPVTVDIDITVEALRHLQYLSMSR